MIFPWAYFLCKKITKIHFRKNRKEKETELQSQVYIFLRELVLVTLQGINPYRQKWRCFSAFYCGKSLSLASYKRSVLYKYLRSFLELALQKSISSVMLDGHKFKMKVVGIERNKRLIDLQGLYSTFSSSIPLLQGMARHGGPMS